MSRLSSVSEHWDVLVIGGGISGAGVAAEAARRGWKTLLVEARDYAWGTSSRSSKLVHGGLRYLKEGQLGLTLHSVRERQALMQAAPDLIQPQSFLFGDYRDRPPGRWLFELGLRVYDAMGRMRSHRYVHNPETDWLVPGLRLTQRKGAMTYLDAKTDDARLVWRVLQEAMAAGAQCLNYVRVEALLQDAQGQVNGAQLHDVLDGASLSVTARVVISATGVWADQLRTRIGREACLRPLRGSHLLLPFWRLPVAQSVSFMHPQDGRPVFLYPWEGVTLVGTTDLDHREDLNLEPGIRPEEVDYLLAALADQFPGARIGREDILSTYAGVRPVLDDGETDPSKATRDHVVLNESGLVTLTGGKLTTYRLMANDALAAAAARLGKGQAHANVPFTPASRLPWQVPASLRQRLRARYGHQAARVWQDSAPENRQTVGGSTVYWLELVEACRHEQVQHLDDLLLRRTRLGNILPQGAAAWLPDIAERCLPVLGWSPVRWQSECERYLALIARCYALPGPLAK